MNANNVNVDEGLFLLDSRFGSLYLHPVLGQNFIGPPVEIIYSNMYQNWNAVNENGAGAAGIAIFL